MIVREWCEANGVTQDAYYYWLRKIRKIACQNLPAVDSPTVFRKLDVNAPVSDPRGAVIIHLPTTTLEVQNGASKQTVEAVLLALKSIC